MTEQLTDPNPELEINLPLFDAVKTVGGVMEELHGLRDEAEVQDVFSTAEPLVRLLADIESEGGKKLKDILDGLIDAKPFGGEALPLRRSLKDTFYLISKFADKSRDFLGSDKADTQTLKEQIVACIQEAIGEKKIPDEQPLETRVGISVGTPQYEVAGSIYSMLIDGQFDDDEELLKGVEALGNAGRHELFITRGIAGSYFSGPEYRHPLRVPDIVVSLDTCNDFAEMFKSAVADQGHYSKKSFEKNLGYSYEELAFRYVYAHELGHFLAYELSDYGERGVDAWEQEFLYEHHKENLSTHIEDSVTIEKERFAEGIAQGYMAATLVRAGMDDERLISSIRTAFTRVRIGDAEEAYRKLHDDNGPLGSKEHKGTKFKVAALLGYGLPLKWEEIGDRLEFLKSEQYRDPEKRSTRRSALEVLKDSKTWKEHVTKDGHDPTKKLFDHKKNIHEEIKANEAQVRSRNKLLDNLTKTLIAASIGIGSSAVGFAGAIRYYNNSAPPPSGIEAIIDDARLGNLEVKKHEEKLTVTAEIKELQATSQEMVNQAYDLVRKGAETVQLYNITGQKLTVIISNTESHIDIDGQKVDITPQANDLQATSFALEILGEDPQFSNHDNLSKVIPKVQQKRGATHDNTGRQYGVYEFDLTKLVP